MHTIEIYLKTGAVIEINRKTSDGPSLTEATNLIEVLGTHELVGFIDRNIDNSIRSSIQLRASDIAGFRVYDGLKYDLNRPNFIGGDITITDTADVEKISKHLSGMKSSGM